MDVAFKDLVPGTEINARTTGRTEGIDELAQSILEAGGLIQPLAVRTRTRGSKTVYEIVDGRRRHAAISSLVKARKWPASREVPVLVVDVADTDARALSLAANIHRLPLHPVDQFEAFAAIAAAGMDAATIARRFAITPRQVRQVLALGVLHPDVRAAWRDGRIVDAAARTFTMEKDPERQARILAAALEQRATQPWTIRKAIVGEQADALHLLRFVGDEAYVEAGGTIVESLFDDVERGVTDLPLLQKLVADRLAVVAKQLLDAGYAFAVTPGEPGFHAVDYRDFDHDFFRSRAPEEVDGEEEAEVDELAFALAVDPERRGGHGFRVSVGYRGDLVLAAARATDRRKTDRGGDAVEMDTTADEDGEERPDDAAKLSGALTQVLLDWRTEAFRQAFAEDPLALVRLMIAGGDVVYCPVFNASAARVASGSWSDRLEDLRALGTDALLKRLAGIYAGAVGASVDPKWRGEVAALAGLLDPVRLREHLVAAFRADEFFARAPARIAVATLVEIDGRNSCLSKKKDDLAALAASKATAARWLPEIMRGPLPAVDPSAPPAPGIAETEAAEAAA